MACHLLFICEYNAFVNCPLMLCTNKQVSNNRVTLCCIIIMVYIVTLSDLRCGLEIHIRINIKGVHLVQKTLAYQADQLVSRLRMLFWRDDIFSIAYTKKRNLARDTLFSLFDDYFV